MVNRARAWKFPTFLAICFPHSQTLVITNMCLEQCVHERGYGRTLGDDDQGAKQKKSYEHGQEPPALGAPEKSEQLSDDTDIGCGLAEQAHTSGARVKWNRGKPGKTQSLEGADGSTLFQTKSNDRWLRKVVQYREAGDPHSPMEALLLQDCRRFAQYLQVERGWHVVPLAESLQSLHSVPIKYACKWERKR